MLPKYLEVQLDIKRRIQSGEFQPGDAIPSERQLTSHYGVSRITIRRAIAELIAKAQLETVQGKGTFVCHTHAHLDLFPLTSCTEDIVRMGLTPSKRVIEANLVEDDNEHGLFIGQSSDGHVFKLSRIFYGNDDPINYTEAYLNYAFFPGLDLFDYAAKSLYDVLYSQYGLVLTRARRTIEAIYAPSKVASYLEVDEMTPILFFRCTTYGIMRGQEIMFEKYSSWYRSDKYAFYIDQTRRRKEGGEARSDSTYPDDLSF